MIRCMPLGLIALFATVPFAVAQEATTADAMPVPEWSVETRALFASLPVQDGGRVKPLDTFAQFTLLPLNGKRSFETPDGRKLDSLGWLMDCLFYPEAAVHYAHFIVDNVAVVEAVGIASKGKRRDRFSYEELRAGIPDLINLAREYEQVESDKRDAFQQQVINLAQNVFAFQLVIHFFDFSYKTFSVQGDTLLAERFPEPDGVPLTTAVERARDFLREMRGNAEGLPEEALNREVQAVSGLFDEMRAAIVGAQGIALIPPIRTEDKVWRSPAEVMLGSLEPPFADVERLGLLANLEALPRLRDDREAFRTAAEAYSNDVVATAKARGEYSKIPLEVSFYNAQYLWRSLLFFCFAFLVVAITWLLPNTKWVHATNLTLITIPWVLLVTGITIRCIIRGRPPVTTLYETILFITAVSVGLCLIMEFINRQRIAISTGAVLGMMGMFLANRYETHEAVDTMPQLIAVLDTTFWLATHVPTVNIGYAAGMLAGALAHVYILGKFLGFRRSDPAFYRNVTRMTYGTLCFGLVFSTIGTILGGIWANDSWGRFWGWDPKENGALMIVLWSLVVLHARMGGYIRDLGIAAGSVILGMIVAFSWWGVNNLGVGLHSYGFTSGLWLSLSVFWGLECVVLGAAALQWYWGDYTAAERSSAKTTGRMPPHDYVPAK